MTKDEAKEELLDLMEELNDYYWCASWMIDCEHELWDLVTSSGPPYPWHSIDVKPEWIERLRDLAHVAGGWWRWTGRNNEYISFEEISEWRALHVAWVVKKEKAP